MKCPDLTQAVLGERLLVFSSLSLSAHHHMQCLCVPLLFHTTVHFQRLCWILGVCAALYMLMDDVTVIHIPSGAPHTLLTVKEAGVWCSVW